MSETKYTVESVGPRVTEFLGTLLGLAKLRLTVHVSEPAVRFEDFENPDVLVSFTGPDVDILLEYRGELLLALEQLTLEMLRVPSNEHARLVFDANDYRMLRIEELRLSALTAADMVKSTNRPFRFNPMTSRERRILHLALRNQDEVRSESSGFGPHRGVVIYPAGMASSPEPAPPPRTEMRRRRR